MNLEELLKKQEALNLELDLFRSTSVSGIQIIQHPLVYAVPYFDAMNAFYNEQLAYKKKALQKAVESKNWGSIIYLHERPHRLAAFMVHQKDFTHEEYWELLRGIWVDSENIWQNKTFWRKALTSNRPQKHLFMDDEEQRALLRLPDKITVYRGYQKGKNKTGYSYSLDKKIAYNLGKRLYKTCDVVIREVNKSDIFAYLQTRGEEEIIILT